MSADASPLDADVRIRQAERDGLRLALAGRAVVLAIAAAWVLLVGSWPAGKLAGLGLLGFAGLGLLYRRKLGSRWDRPVYPYLLLTVDILAVASIFAVVPLSQSDSVPQIFAYRAYGIYYFTIFLGAVALTLSPRLLIYCGLAIVVAWWGAFALVVAEMDRTVSWGDLPEIVTAESYAALLLDPDFIGQGNRIEESIAILTTAGLLALAVYRQRRMVARWIEADRRQQRARMLFGRFVPEQVSRDLMRGGDLAPARREATVLFLDVVGFSAFSETREPGAVIATMNRLFDIAGEAVSAEGGVVLGYQGDGLMAGFNVPGDLTDHPVRAVEAALAIVSRVAETGLAVRIGVHTGPVAAGLVGGAARQSYTLYGDTVNVASRLEQANKETGTSVLLSGDTAAALTWTAMGSQLRPLGSRTVRGHAAPIELFTVSSSE